MKNKKTAIYLILLLIFTMIISACASKSYDSSGSSPGEYFTPNPEMDYGYEDSRDIDKEKGWDKGAEGDKIITTVNISMETKEFTATTEKLEELIARHKAYIERSDIFHNNYINSSRLKYSEYVIRVPRANLEQFVSELKPIGNVISENTNKEDISKQYRDTKSRLRVIETKEERILALLEKADKMEDIINLENQLSEAIYEKELLTANITSMDDKVEYSNLYFHLNEVAKLSHGENEKTPFSLKLKNAFKDSLYFFSYNIQNLAIGLVYFLPYGLIIGVILFFLVRFLKKIKLNKHKD